MESSQQAPQQNTDAWKVGFFVLLVFIVIILAAIGFFIFKQPQPPSITPSPPSVSIPPSISPQVSVEPIQPSPQNQQTDIDSIKQAMAKKHNKPVVEVILTVSKNTGQFAQGSVKFEGEMGGGWFLAAKTADGWVIVDDGNGVITCQVIAPYEIPASIVPECWDDPSGKIVNRV